MTAIGVTGTMASGKSAVAEIFRSMGAAVFDADSEAKKLFERGEIKRIIAEEFGEKVMEAGKVSRKKLAEVVFNDKRKLKRLTDIVHPILIDEVKRALRRMPKKSVLVVDAPLLVESRLDRVMDVVVAVRTPRILALERACSRGFARKDALARMRSQMPAYKKCAAADYVITNAGSIRDLKKKAINVWKRINAVNMDLNKKRRKNNAKR